MGGLFSRKFDPTTDLPSLKGKVIIVSGGNTGIGYGTVKHLARQGATVYLGARDESKATGAIAQLEAEGLGPGFGEIKWLNLDLMDPRKSKAAAEEFISRESRLDIIVNNAGGVFSGTGKTNDGVQQTMMVNHISPYIFTETLIPLLTATTKLENSDVRIVNVSSGAHKSTPAGARFRSLDDFNAEFKDASLPFLAKYGLSKLANILYAKELQKRFDALEVPILCLSVEPGGVKTEGSAGLTSAFPLLLQPVYFLLKWLYFTTRDTGAYNSTFAAASTVVRENPEVYKGVYLSPVGKIRKPSPKALDEELANELTETTNTILRDLGVM